MYYTYALYSLKSKRLYIGSTSDLKRRIDEHSQGKGGEYTAKNRPFILLFYEAFLAKEDAVRQENFYKSGYGKEVLKEKTEYSLKSCQLEH